MHRGKLERSASRGGREANAGGRRSIFRENGRPFNAPRFNSFQLVAHRVAPLSNFANLTFVGNGAKEHFPCSPLSPADFVPSIRRLGASSNSVEGRHTRLVKARAPRENINSPNIKGGNSAGRVWPRSKLSAAVVDAMSRVDNGPLPLPPFPRFPVSQPRPPSSRGS
jgi:hypothetical protein